MGQAGLRILGLDVELARVAGGGVAGGEALLLAARRLAAAHPHLHSQACLGCCCMPLGQY